ncbi:MAG: phosphoadenylyl-sulfate reductase [Burkholderiales bacterium]|nr:phosphoadenylyl-sulfate reductase [Burkholderiales bacterium]
MRALEALLGRIAAEHGPSALASSLSIEDMVLTDAILRRRERGLGKEGNIEIFTLDTGRLHGDTLAVIEAVRRHYGERHGEPIVVYKPQPQAVAQYVSFHGRDGFFESVELRRRCCDIRKVEPLRRALAGKGSWITGLRREQSVTRTELGIEGFDAQHGIPKFNPLADWSENEVWAYVRAWRVPYNALYEQGYRSIGCAPCTLPVVAGEDLRAGRWWWEQAESRECGLHLAPDGSLRRTKAAA